jgi:predicted nucleotidyltransferase
MKTTGVIFKEPLETSFHCDSEKVGTSPCGRDPPPHHLTTFIPLPRRSPLMQSRSDVLATLATLKDELATRFHVAKIGVFGSVSRGEQTPESDIDILVEFSRPVGFFTFMELEAFLSERLGAPVDLVTPDAIKPMMRERIARETAYV